ncbi:MAG: MBL fold metallo-hydrolase [Pseudomonadota bacterium]
MATADTPSRRTVLKRTGLLLAASSVPAMVGTAKAATPATRRIGEVEVTTLSDGHFDLPRAAFGAADGTPPDRLPDPVRLGANVWLLRVGERTILVDAGSGPHLRQTYPATGALPEAMASAALDPTAVTDVVITHMHADHIGGLMDGAAPRFPGATLHMARREWAFWTDPSRPENVPDGQQGLAELIATLFAELTYDLVLYDGEADLGDGIVLVPAPGHTPGHSLVRIASGDAQAMLLGDLVLGEGVQFADPDIRYVLDIDPDLAVRTRRTIFDMLAQDGIPFLATHMTGPAFVQLERYRDGYATVPI